MPPLTVKKVSLPAHFAAARVKTPGTVIMADVLLVDGNRQALGTTTVRLPVVSSTDRRTVTRESTIDGSVQYYAVQPSTADRAKGDPMPGILFSVHGAGVDATGQAGSYAPKKEAHVVAPTNRRPFGFDWEDWGRLDFAEAVAHARAHLVNDPQRSWLSGHSMGGHGTWQLGAHFPGEFAAIAPSAEENALGLSTR
jgi:poly(3-hydroxybutyrate) depolymerase